MDRSQSLCVLLFGLSCWLLAPYPAIERCARPFDRAIIISQLSAPFISLTMVAAFPWYILFCSIPANTSRRWCGSKCYIIMSSCEPPARPVNRVLYISYVYSLTRINHPSHHIICHVYNRCSFLITFPIVNTFFFTINRHWIYLPTITTTIIWKINNWYFTLFAILVTNSSF